ncbi:MAG TPA: hypothetical protein V6C72_00750 [Chroococcales cyanobacterium]
MLRLINRSELHRLAFWFLPAAILFAYVALRLHGRALPPVHIYCSQELAIFLRMLARCVQFLGLIGALSMLVRWAPLLKTERHAALIPVCQAGIICSIALLTPALAKIALPQLLGFNPY